MAQVAQTIAHTIGYIVDLIDLIENIENKDG